MATQYIQDKEGNTFIASTQRADGSFRKPRKVKQGFVPQEEVPLYESKGKKIAKEAKENEGLPVGLTKEAWEKMKEAQAKLLNPQQKTAKKKNNKKKTPSNQGDNLNNNQLNNLEENNAAAKKKKNKTKQNNENNSATVNNTSSSPTNEKSPSPIDDWVTMGKTKPKTSQKSNLDKATSGVKNLSLNNKQKNKSQQQQAIKKRVDDLPISKEVDDLASGMLVDDYHEEENKEKEKLEKNNEKQLLIKKIKTLKKKLKDVESLKELAKQKTLDKEQQLKLNKSGDFAKELNKLQAKLDLINKDK